MVINLNLTAPKITCNTGINFADVAGDEEPGDPYISQSVLRSRQEAAYRSVGALQLRVEELTLEVTKVCIMK